jgi:hypothetical protein
MRKNVSVLSLRLLMIRQSRELHRKSQHLSLQQLRSLKENIVLKIIASGMTAPTYQWYKDNVLKTGQISAEFSKDSVTAADFRFLLCEW